MRALAVLIGLALAGCGDGDPKKIASQVAVKVNAEEITVHQVNAVLARARGLAAEDAAQAKREALERLIGQELARQQAIVKKLDRSPQVVQAIEAARAEILARAYLQQVTAGQPPATAEEVKQYYAAHPGLFAQRRVYTLEEISLVPDEAIAAQLPGRVAGTGSLQEIAEWLNAQEVRVAVSRSSRAAEHLPLELLPTLHQMKDGEMRLVELGGRAHVLRLVASRPAPVDEETARPRIEQFLANQRAGERMAQEMKRLRAQARIEYVGEFSGAAAPAKDDAPINFDRAVRALR